MSTFSLVHVHHSFLKLIVSCVLWAFFWKTCQLTAGRLPYCWWIIFCVNYLDGLTSLGSSPAVLYLSLLASLSDSRRVRMSPSRTESLHIPDDGAVGVVKKLNPDLCALSLGSCAAKHLGYLIWKFETHFINLYTCTYTKHEFEKWTVLLMSWMRMENVHLVFMLQDCLPLWYRLLTGAGQLLYTFFYWGLCTMKLYGH